MPRVIALFGARSEIGLETVRRLADEAVVVLAARPGPIDDAREACLRAGAARVEAVDFDADDVAAHERVVAEIESLVGPIDVAILAFGILGEQALAARDPAEVARVLHTDFVAQASLLTVLAARMRERRAGTLVAFSSVAGRRVRRANYVYGSAKAGLDGFVSGLADALHGSGVDVILARPGFVVGRMTTGMKPAIFASNPAQVGAAVAEAVARNRSAEVWIPGQLRPMFVLARAVPRPIWRRMPR